MRPDPERARLAAEALARARADAWARGERPGPAPRSGAQTRDQSERAGLTAAGPLPATLLASTGAPRPRRDDPQPLTAAFGGLLSARGWREKAAVGAVFGHWADIVGPQLALHTRPEHFESGELTVSADSDAWATQVRMMAPQLLRRLAEELGHGTVVHIRVKGPAGPPRRPGRLRVR
jgi:predicted nucleic acid-binding Zn ribbon protein